ncbi:hypothetical protein [Dyadobacter sp. CY312]|uniref:hypothetical protein n=1 Tax=Dyadobacter sp. CY312 TaxID=2907303 RepID=UPI001F254DCC|nr:hypothetical protein [Dyadobacter sp. CY312]MCE7044076.1 hypothetical protein [Dyadobacter sp. CY312]
MKTRPALSKPANEKGSQSVSEIRELSPLADFFKAIQKDPRISTRHIGVYASLLHYWNDNGRVSPIRVFSHEMIGLVKLSCRDTYFKYIGELSAYGYIRYERSFNRKRPSEIYLHAAAKDHP